MQRYVLFTEERAIHYLNSREWHLLSKIRCLMASIERRPEEWEIENIKGYSKSIYFSMRKKLVCIKEGMDLQYGCIEDVIKKLESKRKNDNNRYKGVRSKTTNSACETVHEPSHDSVSRIELNRIELNRIELNRIELNRIEVPPIVPQGGDDPFELLWSAYPRKDGKKSAKKHFNATVKTPDDYSDIQKALRNYKEKIQVEGMPEKYIKNGSTWFNNWRDWVEREPPKSGADQHLERFMRGVKGN